MASARTDRNGGVGPTSKRKAAIDASSECRDGDELRAAKYRVPFPDDEPRRRIHFVKLPRNALPPLQSERSPTRTDQSVARSRNNAQCESSYRLGSPTASTSVSTAVQNVRRQHIKRKATQGPPSPTQSSGVRSSKLRGLAAKYLPRKELLEQWVAVHASHSRQDGDAAEASAPPSSVFADDQARQADYDLYLYLASKYGALEGVLYCCNPFPGRVYQRLVDVSARRLQRWSRRRMHALRRYWVAYLAQLTATFAQDSGLTAVSRSYHHEQIAFAHLHRLRRLQAVRALRRWHDYVGRMDEVRTRFADAVERDFRARFSQWRERTAAVKQFKRQLKTIARRKAMEHAMDQWQQRKQLHAKLRHHLSQRWLKTQRECLVVWMRYARTGRVVRRIQRAWRLYRWRRARAEAGALITAVAKGFLGRSRLRELQQKVEVGRVVIRLVEQLVWANNHEEVVKQRAVLLEKEITRAYQEQQYVLEAERAAEARVNRDLSTIVRNTMHQRLQDTIRSVKESQASGGNVEVLKNHELLRSLAARQLAEQQREGTRAEAIAAFRCASADNRPLERCLLCSVQVEGELPLACFRSVDHDCISTEGISGNPEGDRESLNRLQAKERAHVRADNGRLGMIPGKVHAYIEARWPKVSP